MEVHSSSQYESFIRKWCRKLNEMFSVQENLKGRNGNVQGTLNFISKENRIELNMSLSLLFHDYYLKL